MTIPIHRQPDSEPPFEVCCFCRTPTEYWTSLTDRRLGGQVACCPHCASRGDPQDVPSKEVWCRRELIAHHPTIWEISRGWDREYSPAPICAAPTK